MSAETAVETKDAMVWTVWEERAYALIRDEMRRRRINMRGLAEKLTAIGLRTNRDQVTRKLNRKRFSAACMLACLVALEVDAVRMRDVLKLGARAVPAKASTT